MQTTTPKKNPAAAEIEEFIKKNGVTLCIPAAARGAEMSKRAKGAIAAKRRVIRKELKDQEK